MRTASSSPPPPYSPPRPHHTFHHHNHTAPGGDENTSRQIPQTNRRVTRSSTSSSQLLSSNRNVQQQETRDGIVLSPLSCPSSSNYSTQGGDWDESSFCSNTNSLVTSTPSTASSAPLYHTGGGRWYRKYCNHRVPSVVVFGVVAATFAVTYLYMVVVYRLQPTPVVDEAFHIPQAQKYCQGNFNEWDPKLTTLPGLYLFSIGITGPISWLLSNTPSVSPPEVNLDSFDGVSGTSTPPSVKLESNDEVGVCSVLMLRLVNVIVAPCILLALHSLMCFMHNAKASEWSCLASSVNMVMLPPLFWFYSLYYTEPLAVMLVLLMFLLYCHDNHALAAIIGVVSIIVRQTNIVWVFFLLALRAVDSCLRHLNAMTGANIATLHTVQHLKVFWRRITTLFQACPWNIVRLTACIIQECIAYVGVLCGFLLFWYINGGLVVGDRSAHEATLHFTQMFYFFMFVIFFSPSLAMASLPDFMSLCCKHPKTVISALALSLTIIHNNTLVHPYLLADNRHYTFYLWNKFYARHYYFRYMMAPAYLFGGHLVWNICLQKRSNIFRLIYLSCMCLSIVPQRLLEPRYFILPFIVARMQHSPFFEEDIEITSNNRNVTRNGGSRRGNGNSRNRTFNIISNYCSNCLRFFKLKCNKLFNGFPLAHICWEFLYYLIINLTTLAIFGSKTFWWKDFPEPQRIMW